MITILPDAESLARAAAELFVERAQECSRNAGRFSVVLSGGNTPQRVYEILATPEVRSRVPWDTVHVFWGDERCVPPDDLRSNQRMARQALLNHVAIPAANVHPISGIMPPDQAAWQYEELLREYFAGRPPQFDLVFLGLGENGHTASLWPGSEAIHEANRWVVAVFVPELDMFRVTMTAPLLNQAAAVVFLVTGAGKADVLREVLEGPGDVSRLPAQLIQPLDGKLGWLVEEASAAKLTRQS